jgi:hypothetical protein
MRTLLELKEAVKNGKKLVWNDSDPIHNCEYVITFIQDLSDIEEEDIEDYPILVQYDGCSEAHVYLHEIILADEND